MTPAAQHPATEPVLSVRNLTVHVRTRAGVGVPVNDVTFELYSGETLGLVGESGSGKSLTALSILALNPKPATEIVGGEVWFDGSDLLSLSESKLRRYRGARISLIPQDPLTSLNPVLSIEDQITETLYVHTRLRGEAARRRAVELLDRLRVPDPRARLRSYPHQLSGGLRQRVVGAIALAARPDVLLADEPTTALDPTVQAAYLDLLVDIQRDEGLAVLFITHDFAVVANVCHRVAVMYAGRIVEQGKVDDLLEHAWHPYSKALLRSIPDAHSEPRPLESIEGQPPAMQAIPGGCAFHPRCSLYKTLNRPGSCRDVVPQLRQVSRNQSAACHYAEQN